MGWYEADNGGLSFSLAKNKRPIRINGGELLRAKVEFRWTGKAARLFADFLYRTKTSCSAERRVVD